MIELFFICQEAINDEDRMKIWEACTNDDLEMV